MDDLIGWDFNIDDKEFVEYPYKGYFYEIVVPDDVPLDERVPEEKVVFKTICDIQRSSRLHVGNLLAADYTIYFPLDENISFIQLDDGGYLLTDNGGRISNNQGTVDMYGPILVRRGHRFRGEFYGYTLEGVVEFVRPSQLGMCSVDIKINTESSNG